MANLKVDHPYLYKRVRLKAILHIALGATLIFLPDTAPTSQGEGEVSQAVTRILTYFGLTYLLIGILLTIGVFRARQNYSFAQKVLLIASIYNTTFLGLIIAILIDKPNRSTAYIAALYAYLVYNMWLITRDPAWRAVELLKGHNNGSRATGR